MVQPGIKIKDLLNKLEENGYTLSFFEDNSQYYDSKLIMNDILFNNYNGNNNGKIIDNYIQNIKVVIPYNQTTLNVRQNYDMTLSGLNLKKYLIYLL